MRSLKEVNDQYSNACARLGHASTEKRKLEAALSAYTSAISKLEFEIDELAREAAQINAEANQNLTKSNVTELNSATKPEPAS